MKILVDIGHPAHVHYFKNFIWIMGKNGHSITIIARDKEVVFSLLDYYKLPYINRGKGKNGLLGKLFYMAQADWFILRKAMKHKPDIFISAGSMYAAQTAWLMRKPHIALDDTDHNSFQQMMYVPFTKAVITPDVFQKNFGKKQVRFNGFLELSSLHPKRYKPAKENVKQLLGIQSNERYVVLRFVSWNATHDIGLKGLSLKEKYLLVQELSKHAKVIISSEAKLPDDLIQYSFSIHPALMHDVLKEASLLVSESLTMAAEAVFLGTPAVCISAAQAGTLDEEVRLGLIDIFRSSEGLIDHVVAKIQQKDLKETFIVKSNQIVNAKVDLSGLLVWFVENFPASLSVMNKTPEQQLNFI